MLLQCYSLNVLPLCFTWCVCVCVCVCVGGGGGGGRGGGEEGGGTGQKSEVCQWFPT